MASKISKKRSQSYTENTLVKEMAVHNYVCLYDDVMYIITIEISEDKVKLRVVPYGKGAEIEYLIKKNGYDSISISVDSKFIVISRNSMDIINFLNELEYMLYTGKCIEVN